MWRKVGDTFNGSNGGLILKEGGIGEADMERRLGAGSGRLMVCLESQCAEIYIFGFPFLLIEVLKMLKFKSLKYSLKRSLVI